MADSAATAVLEANLLPYTSDADPLPIPPLDPLYFSSSNPDQNGFINSDFSSFNFDENFDLDFDFDGFPDPLFFSSETDSFPPLAEEANGSPESGNSVVCGVDGGGCSDVGKYFNRSAYEAGSSGSDEGSAASGAAAAAAAAATAADAGFANCTTVSPVSSHGSGNGGKSDVSEAMNASSPDSGTSTVKDDEANVKKKGGDGGGALPKRKKEASHDATARRQKCRVSEAPKSNSLSQGSDTKTEECEEDEKKKARLMRNRESAQLSRQRKKHYVEELEDKVRTMHSAIADLNGKVSYFMAENASLRQQLGGGGNGLFPPPMYPPPVAPMAYPWMTYPPYMVKPQGSQVPLVPIPRLKPQQPVASAKSKKDQASTKKPETKTKKVASVSFLGLLCFFFMFGVLVPVIDVKYGGPAENVATRFDVSSPDQHFRGRVLLVDGHSNRSSDNSVDRIRYEKGKTGGAEHIPKPIGFAHPDNSSEMLPASLYVPRNDKLVKIDGNLIIHSILAGERAAKTVSQEKKTQETGLAILKDFSGALAIRDGMNRARFYRTSAEQQKAIGSGSADNLKEQFKSSAADGKLQQWFHQGLAGPMLSSDVCSEVFRFDVSPSPGAIVSSPPVTNLTKESHPKTTPSYKRKHRRILHGLPVPFPGSDLNVTGQHKATNNQTFNIQGNTSKPPASSIVVSLLVDPREIADTEVDGVLAPKSLSRVFVVVLVDSARYVTYSCMLPRSSPHLVRA